jgi:hypothetical protein
LIKGNHDDKNLTTTGEKEFFDFVAYQMKIRIGKRAVYLNHYPFLCYAGTYREPKDQVWALHGHIHLGPNSLSGLDVPRMEYLLPTQYDVGVDMNDFAPISWEEVKKKSEFAIKRWINSQMVMRSCLVVLIGEETWMRDWVEYEIRKAYELEKGIVGIYIHNLKDKYGNQTEKGLNPFDYINTINGEPLSKYVRAFDSRYATSSNVYRDINDNLSNLIEEAIENAGYY